MNEKLLIETIEKLLLKIKEKKEINEKQLLDLKWDCIEIIPKLNKMHRATYATAAGIIYIALHNQKIPINLQQLAIILWIERMEIGRAYKKIKREIGLKNCPAVKTIADNCLIPYSTESFVKSFSEKLNLSKKIQQEANEIIEKLNNQEIDIPSNNPSVIAGCAVYISALMNGENKTQQECAGVMACSPTCVRINYKAILEAVSK